MIAIVIASMLGFLPSFFGNVAAPYVNDEFSNLLAAKTFALGRLTNPTPAMWEHFETLHELMRPTYMSKYPPGEALALTPGVWLGVPLLGAIATVAAGCGATAWMLQAWLPSRWALLGGLLAISMPMLFTWSQNFGAAAWA